MFGQQPYVYQQPIYNQPPMPPMQDPQMQMRPQYQSAPQLPTYQPQPQQPQNQSIIWVPNEQAANDFIVAPNNAVTLWDMNAPIVYVKKGRCKRETDHDDLRSRRARTGRTSARSAAKGHERGICNSPRV